MNELGATKRMAGVIDGDGSVVMSSVDSLGVDKRFVMGAQPDGRQAAAYRLVAHQLARGSVPASRILVTSASAGEGKSTCAANLAAAFAELPGARPVLVDLHLQSPGIASLLRMEHVPQSVFQAMRDDQRPLTLAYLEDIGLAVLAAATENDQGRLVDSQPIARLLDRMTAAGMGPLIIDGPPVLGHVDANLILDHCDAALIVARAGKSHARALHSTRRQLEPGAILGVVLLDA